MDKYKIIDEISEKLWEKVLLNREKNKTDIQKFIPTEDELNFVYNTLLSKK